MSTLITGIQQIGIGVSDIDTAWSFYRKTFGTDVPVFDDEAEAKLMSHYTGNEVHSRRAVLALNMNGGGGFEIWQFKSRTPQACAFKPEIGDLGINAVKMKCRNIDDTYRALQQTGLSGFSNIHTSPDQTRHIWVTDPVGNRFQIVEGESWFRSNSQPLGGVCGVIIGVSDIDRALPLYQSALGFDSLIYDETGTFADLEPGVNYRRVLLRKNQSASGAFSKLFGHTDVELIQLMDQKPRKIFENRYWGDLGFIHVCFDVTDMDRLKEMCLQLGYPFTVDSSNTFDMGEAAGRFSYIEDPDGTLIEFVQAHKLPIMKKWGWYLNLKNRKNQKPLPSWMLKTMSFNRVTD
jgi:catechol 2,3-dioxygenase-like lactoylglutathione lyase family enzyme